MGNSIPRFFIPSASIGPGEAVIEGAEARHAHKVLRLRTGDRLIVSDGAGKQYQARIVKVEAHRLRVSLEAPLAVQTESPVDIAVAQGFLKDKKMDMLVRHLTELGVRRWIPFMARRSVPAPGEQRLQTRSQRWQKISQEAVKQCRRHSPMTIEPAVSFEAALALAVPYELKLIFWEEEADFLSAEMSGNVRPVRIFVMIGPEGGFEASEIEAALSQGFRPITMGPRILRAETAALTACSLVQYVFGDMGENCP